MQRINDLTAALVGSAMVQIPLADAEKLISELRKIQNAADQMAQLWDSLRGPDPETTVSTTATTTTNAAPLGGPARHPEPTMAAWPTPPAKAPEPPPAAQPVRAYVSPPPAPPPLPQAQIDRLAARFNVTPVTKPAAAPAPAPVKTSNPNEGNADAPRYAHFKEAESRFPPDVFSMLREGVAPWKAWRIHRGLRSVDVCNITGWSSSRIADIENRNWKDGRHMNAETLRKMSEALEVPVVDLVPELVKDYPMLDRAELDRREREYEAAERDIARNGQRKGGNFLRQNQRMALATARRTQTRVDVIGLHPRETQECKRSARDLPLSIRFLSFDEFTRSTPSVHVVAFTKGVPHTRFDVSALKAKGTTVRFANGGVSSVLDMLRAVVAAEATDASVAA